MYERFFGFRERPFDLTSSLKYLLLTPKHEEALSNLDYGILAGKALTLLLGEPGTGKTTLLRKAHSNLLERAGTTPVWAYINNPTLRRDEFFDTLAHAFKLDYQHALKSQFLRDFQAILAEHRQAGIETVLVIDEAQSLPDELLEEVRLLANLETETGASLRVVVAGQPALGERLTSPTLRQFKQRVGLRCALPALDLRETAAYIAHRISLAGGNPGGVFSREAVMMIHERSQGIPRTINVICDNALLTGFAEDQRPVGARLVLEVCRDFDLTVHPTPLRSRTAADVSVEPVPTGTHPQAVARAAGSVPGSGGRMFAVRGR
jgi:general secretion pathway protein A